MENRQINHFQCLINAETARGKLNHYEGGGTYPVRFTYDDEGRMTSMTTYRDESGPGDTTVWTYDAATGVLLNKTYADNKGPSYTYTPDGKLASRIWARGIVTSYAYSPAGELTALDYSDATPDVTYAYDRLGRVLAVADVLGTRTNVYDVATLSLVEEHLPDGTVLSRSTDELGRPSGLSLGADYSVSYAYDAYGRFAAVSSAVGSASSVANYAYVPGSRLVAGYTIGELARLVSYEPQRDLIASVTNAWNDSPISSFAYQNDAIGLRAERTDSGSVTNRFGYNHRSEVTFAVMGTNVFGYAYDPIGNRLVATNNAVIKTYVANALNQYTNIINSALVTPTCDDDGNLTTNGVWVYTWDGENRLTGVSSNGVDVAAYAHDFASRRVMKTAQGVTRGYLYDGWNLIRESVDSNFTHYVWGLDLSGSLQGAGGVGGLLAVIHDDNVYHPSFDANGNVTEYISPDGTLAAHYEYSPFGETIIQSGDLAETFAFRFSSKYWENEVKLYYYGYRFYVPSMGRWLSKDLIGKIGGLNLYAFVSNDTVGSVDVYGLVTLSPPATPVLCEKLARIMAFNSVAAGPVSYSLWMRWLENRGGSEILSMASFDPVGTCRDKARAEVFKSLDGDLGKMIEGLPCEGTMPIKKKTTPPQSCTSPNLMILRYALHSSYSGSLTRHCKDCCSMFVMDITINHRATDRTDFNNGLYFPALPWYEIADELANQCFHAGNNDFDIYSDWSESSPFFIFTCDKNKPNKQ